MSSATPPGTSNVSARPLVLIVIDGWGCAPDGPSNAIALAKTPVMDRLWRDYPHTTLKTSGYDVGLPLGQMGNSEVGHLNIGAGRVVMQDLPRISADRDQQVSNLVGRPLFRDGFDRNRIIDGSWLGIT